jgi:hypothetical protein
MSELLIKGIKKANESLFDKGTHLVLFYVNKTPPHLAIISDGKYFSITVKGDQIGEEVIPIFQLIQRKRIPTLFVSLRESVAPEFLLESFRETSLNKLGTTCIEPISRSFRLQFSDGVDYTSVQTFFDLYELLKQTNRIQSISQYFLSENQLCDFTLSRYNKEDVVQFVQELKQNRKSAALPDKLK